MRKFWLVLIWCSAVASAQNYWVKAKAEAPVFLANSAELQQAIQNEQVHVTPLISYFKTGSVYAENPALQRWVFLEFKSNKFAEMLLPQLDVITYYEEKPVAPPYDIAPVTPDYLAQQSHILENPGHNFQAAWDLGFTGLGQHVRDIEYGFHKTHEEFHQNPLVDFAPNTQINAAASYDYIVHGTHTLGVLVADPTNYGVKGMVHDAQATLYTEWPSTGYNRVAAIANAINAAAVGDVLLFEMQAIAGQATPVDRYVPAEYQLAVWDLTQAATANGLVIVGAAGNGQQDLDSEFYISYISRGDSGAIIVGAGSNSLTHQPLWYSTYGQRVDVQAWGNQVLTSGNGSTNSYAVIGGDVLNQSYAWYSGTSSASSLVAAAAVLMQQAALTYLDRPLTSTEIRGILKETGDPQLMLLNKPIGPSVNVLAAIQAIQALQTPEQTFSSLQVAPNPSTGRVSWSVSVANAQWELYDLLGKTLQKGDASQGQLDLTPYSKGMYFLRFTDGNRTKNIKLLRD